MAKRAHGTATSANPVRTADDGHADAELIALVETTLATERRRTETLDV
jgi:hypothetical protein